MSGTYCSMNAKPSIATLELIESLPYLRVRDNLCHTLTRKYCDEIGLYQAAQETFKRETINKIKRQVQIVKPNATDEEVKEVLTSEGGRDALYRELVLDGRVSPQVQ